jgi:hypothetical protein
VVHTVKVSVHFQNNLLTFVDDFSEQVLSPEEVSRRAVPALVAELVLALVDGDVGPLGQGHQQARVVSSQAALLAAQGAVDGGVHVEDARRDGGQVVRLPALAMPLEQGKIALVTGVSCTLDAPRPPDFTVR